MNKKKLRIAGITILILVAIAACYAGYFMQSQPLMDCVEGTDPANSGTIVQYEQDKEPVTLTVENADQIAGLWEAIQTTGVRFLQGRGMPSAPVGGAYYEVTLTAIQEDGAQTGAYSFGCSTNGKMVIVGSNYEVVGESDLVPQLEALFAQAAG